MARPRLNIEQDIIAAMHRAARHGYPVVHVWQIELWMDGVQCSTRTIYNYLKRMESSGQVQRYAKGNGYTLPKYKTLREQIADAHHKLRNNSITSVAEYLGVNRKTVNELKES